jgi:flagellar hook-associated protein FlgK
MVDLVAIGSSGVNVYKRALATVSNNIANMGTEGYSRQVTDIRQATPTEAGKSTIGNGAYFDRVSRQYDKFLEASLQQATSDLESQGATVEFAKRLLDLIGNEKLGATSALSKFFGSAKALSTDPGSTALRNAMYRDAEELVSRFNSLAEQIDSLGEQAISAMNADIEALNGLSAQIASVNRNLLKKKLEQNQPPQLLDQRDQLLRDLSQYAGIKTAIDSQGLVSVSLTQSMLKGVLVNKVEGYELSAAGPDPQTNSVTFQVKGGLETASLSEILSGSIAGYAKFIQETTSSLGQTLNNIVTVLVAEVNTIQTAGLDGLGREGEPFFELEPGIKVDKGASRGDYDVSPLIDDLERIINGSYSFTFDSGRGGWIPDPGQAVNQEYSPSIPGMNFSIAGTPLDGDRFTVDVFDDAASGIRMGIRDGLQIAASSLFRITPGPNNVGSLQPTVNFEPPVVTESPLTAGPTSVGPAASEPVRVVTAGQSETLIKLDPGSASSLSVDIITRDGRHLVGEADVAGLTSIVDQSMFFSESANYSDQYLNLSGFAENSYKDFEIDYGAFGETNSVTQLRPLSGNVLKASTTTDFASGFIDFSVGLLDENTSLDLIEDASINQADGAISIVSGVVYRGTGGGSEQIGTVSYPYGPSSPSFDSLRVNLLGTPVEYNFENASFEDDAINSTSITGWTVVNEQIKLGQTAIAGYTTPVDSTTPTSSAGDSNTPSTLGTLSTKVVAGGSDGSQSVVLESSGMTTLAGFDVVHGPAMYTDSTVALKPGDTVSFDWKAQGGADSYDVYGYFINESTGNTFTVLDQTGTTSDWQTEQFAATESGNYRFVFVSGTYDASGGRASGARLYVDNLVVDADPILPPNIDVSVLNEIASRLTIENGQDLSGTPYPLISTVSVEAVTSNGRGQFSEVYNFNSEQLITEGRVDPSVSYRSRLIGKEIPLFSGMGTSVVEADKLSVNGTNLGALTVGSSGVEGYGRLSVLDIKSWIDAAGVADVSVRVSNEIFVSSSTMSLSGSGLSINGVDIVSQQNGVTTVFEDAVDVVQSINYYSSSTGVSASVERSGDIRLSNTSGANIKISSSAGDVNPNLLGIANSVYAGQYSIVQSSSSSSALAVEILDGGGAEDLNSVGLDTSIIIRGDIDEDLGIFIRGTGDAELSSRQITTGQSFVSGLRDRVIDIQFTAADAFSIVDRSTGTIVAERDYSGERVISYQGMTIQLDRPAAEGDIFTIDGNNTAPGQAFDAQGNNVNLMRILDLETRGVVSGQTLTEAYLDLIGDVGNEATQAEISYEALEVLEAQAEEARDRVSGVSLDREAADLIRFQQAYQASAQIIQIASRIFDDMLRIQ